MRCHGPNRRGRPCRRRRTQRPSSTDAGLGAAVSEVRRGRCVESDRVRGELSRCSPTASHGLPERPPAVGGDRIDGPASTSARAACGGTPVRRTRSPAPCGARHTCWKRCRQAGASASSTMASGHRASAAASVMPATTPAAAGEASTIRDVPGRGQRSGRGAPAGHAAGAARPWPGERGRYTGRRSARRSLRWGSANSTAHHLASVPVPSA